MSGGPSSQVITGIYILLIVIMVVLAWTVLCGLISWLDGWRDLIRRFRFQGKFEGATWRFVSGWMRWGTHFGGALTVGVNKEGIYLRMTWLIRAGHPPLFIPWTEITMRKSQGGFFPKALLMLGREEQVPLMITRRMSERILPSEPDRTGTR